MALYDYECRTCREVFEVRATIAEKEAGLAPVCPHCGAPDARQRLSVASVLRLSDARSPRACGPGSGSGCCSR